MNYTTIALIVNLLFVLILVAGFLVGLWRGLKKSAVNVIFAFAAALLAFFVTIPVTNAILGISLNGTPLKETLVNMILSQESIKNLVTSVPSLETLIAGIPTAIAGTIMFIILTCLAEGVFYIIYKIVAIAFLRNKKTDDDEEPPKKHRLLGGAVGLVKTFVVLVFAFLPLTALTGLFQDLTKENDYFQVPAQAAALTDEQQSHNILTKNLPQIALDGVKAFDDSAFGVFGGVFGLDNAVFDYYANVDIEGQKVYIRQEIETYWQAVDLYTCITNADGRQLKELDFEKVDPVINGILDSGLYNTVVKDALTAIVTDYDQIGLIPADTLDQFKDVLDAVAVDLNATSDKAAYFSDDINKIYDMFKSLAQSGLIDDINSLESKELTDILDMFSKEENQDAFATCLNDLFTTNIVRAAAKPVVKLALGGIIEDIDQIAANTADWLDEDWQAVADNLVDSITYAQDLMAEVDLTKILDDPLVLLQEKEGGGYYDLAKIFENLGGLVDTLRANKLFVNSEGTPVVDTMLEGNFSLPNKTVIASDGKEEIHFENPSLENPYTQLFTKVFAGPMTAIQQSGLYEIIKTSDSVDQVSLFKLVAEQGEDFLLKTILPLTQVEPTQKLLVEDLLQGMQDAKINFGALETYDDWKGDLTQIGQLVCALNDIEIDGTKTGIDTLFTGEMKDFLLKLKAGDVVQRTEGGPYRSNGDLSTLIKPMLFAKSTKGFTDDIFKIIGDALTTLTKAEPAIEIKITEQMLYGEDNQVQEICDILENFLPVYTLYNNGTTALEDLTAEPLGMLLNVLRDNTYREGGNGAFSQVFNSLTKYLEATINEKLSLTGTGREVHFDTMAEGGIKKLDFVSTLQPLLNQLKNPEISSR